VPWVVVGGDARCCQRGDAIAADEIIGALGALPVARPMISTTGQPIANSRLPWLSMAASLAATGSSKQGGGLPAGSA